MVKFYSILPIKTKMMLIKMALVIFAIIAQASKIIMITIGKRIAI